MEPGISDHHALIFSFLQYRNYKQFQVNSFLQEAEQLLNTEVEFGGDSIPKVFNDWPFNL